MRPVAASPLPCPTRKWTATSCEVAARVPAVSAATTHAGNLRWKIPRARALLDLMIWNSMRRFAWRPAFVALLEMGSSGPSPRVSMRLASTPRFIR